MDVTRFPNEAAFSRERLRLTLREVEARIKTEIADDYDHVPWFKLGLFGDDAAASPSGRSYRSNANFRHFDGVELDFDNCPLAPLQARHRLRTAGLAALIYTTPSHGLPGKGNRFRVFLPCSASLPPPERAALIARANGVLGGFVDDASFTLSQGFRAGSVRGAQPIATWLIDGRCIDKAAELDAGAKWKRGREKGAANDNMLDEEALLEAIRTSAAYHTSVMALAGKWASQDVSYVKAFQRLRAAFKAVPDADRDARWRERFAAIPTNLAYVYGHQAAEDHAERERKERAFADEVDAETQAEIDAAIEALVGGKGGRREGLTFTNPRSCATTNPPPYVVKGLLAEGDVGCIVGAPGVGKSLLGPRLGYAVAQGEPIFGMRTKSGRVFYVAAEDEAGMRGRVAALRQAHGEADDFTLVGGVSDLMTVNSAHLKALKVAIAEKRPKLVVIDTLAIAFPGLEENDAKAMGRVVAVARSLAQWGAAVLLIHHDTKAGDGLPRGHGVLNGALDVSVALAKDGDIVRAKASKSRRGPSDRDIAFTIDVRTVGVDEDGEPYRAALCRELTSAPEREVRPTRSARAAFNVLASLMKGRAAVPEEEWRKACVEGRSVSGVENPESRAKAFRRAAEELTRAGKVAFAEGAYSLTVIRGGERFTSEGDEDGSE